MLEFGPQGFGLRAHGMAVLRLLRHFRAQPEIGEAPADEREEIVHQRNEEFLDAAILGRNDPGKPFMDHDDHGCDGERTEQREHPDQGHAADRHSGGERPRGVDATHGRRDPHQADEDEPRPGKSDGIAVIDDPLRHHVGDREQPPAQQLDPPEQGQAVPPGKQDRGQGRAPEEAAEFPRRLGIRRRPGKLPFRPAAIPASLVRRLSCRVHRLDSGLPM